jgi:hypothetical protein
VAVSRCNTRSRRAPCTWPMASATVASMPTTSAPSRSGLYPTVRNASSSRSLRTYGTRWSYRAVPRPVASIRLGSGPAKSAV